MAQENTYDLVIVGGGTAGCILAARIAEHGIHPHTKDRLRIALIEAGPYFRGDPRHGYGIPLRRRMFTNVSAEFRGAGRYTLRGGSMVLGGSSVTFGAQSHLPFSADYANWEYTTGVDWTEENVKEAADEVRRVFNVHADPDEFLSDGQRRFRESARSLGYDVQPYEGAKKNCIRCGYCLSSNMCKYDAKMSTLLTHVPTAERFGVNIIPDAMAHRLVFEGKRAAGVVYRQEGQDKFLQGEKILLSCGAVQTPLLLWKSGVGPKDLLGSQTVIASPNVGRRAHCHPENYIWALFPEPIKDGERGWNAGSYFLHRMNEYGHDALFVQDSGMGGLAPPHEAAANEFAPEFGPDLKRFVDVGRRSLGRVVLWTTPKEAEGHLDEEGRLVYETDHPAVRSRLKEGIEIGIDILRDMGAARWTPPEVLLENIRTPHLASTCRAGVDPKTSVVDSHFQCHDMENLFICDGSVLPRTSIGSLAMAIATVATFAAQRMVEDHFS